MADVLEVVRSELSVAEREEEVTRRLMQASRGYPLLVRLYVNLLRGRNNRPEITEADLDGIRPGNIEEGMADFFDWWHNRFEVQSGKAETVAVDLESVMATARGRLPKERMSDLAGIEWPRDRKSYELAWHAISYLLEGDAETGYVFSHPEFGSHLRKRMEAKERRHWQDRFLAWGEAELAELEALDREPEQVSPYLVRHHGVHLEEATHRPLAWRIGELDKMLGERWCAAWQRKDLDGLDGYTGYLGDVARTLRWCDQAHHEAARKSGRLAHMGLEIRCLLIQASIRSLAGNIPGELLSALVEAEIWPASQAIAYLEQIPDEGKRGEAVIGRLADTLAVTQESAHELLRVARIIEDASARSWAMAEVAARLSDAQHLELLELIRDLIGAPKSSYKTAEVTEPLNKIVAFVSVRSFLGLWSPRADGRPGLRDEPARQGRDSLLRILPSVLPVLERFGTPDTIRRVAAAIAEVGRRWP